MEDLVNQTVNIEMPENKYEQIVYLEMLVDEINKVQQEALTKIEELKTELLNDESDPNYHLVKVFDNRKTTLIDEKRLKEDNPELYSKCLSITGANAMKLIGEDKMWQLCVKYAGEERTVAASSLTLKKMKQSMTDEEYKDYTTEIYKEKGVAVSKKE